MRVLGNIYALTASVVLLALPARAEEAGLPQLDTSLFAEQIFWLALSFGVLYLLMSVVALPRVAKTKDHRKQVIADELEAARIASDAARQAVAQVEKSLIAARAEAQAHVSEMIAKVKEEAAERRAAQERELMRHLHSAEADISVTRESALTAVRASDLAAVVVDKILGARGRAA